MAEIIKIGGTIRNREPYWGEPGYRVVGSDIHGFKCVWTGSKHGPGDKDDACAHHISFNDVDKGDYDEGPFRICSRWELFKLWVLGQTYGRIAQSHNYGWIGAIRLKFFGPWL